MFKCQFCGYRFESAERLGMHQPCPEYTQSEDYPVSNPTERERVMNIVLVALDGIDEIARRNKAFNPSYGDYLRRLQFDVSAAMEKHFEELGTLFRTDGVM